MSGGGRTIVPAVRIFKHHIRTPFLALAGVEFLILAASIYAAAKIVFWSDFSEAYLYVGPLFPRAVIFATVMVIAMFAMGLYQADLREGLPGILLRVSISFILGIITLAVIFYVYPGIKFGRGIMGAAVFVGYLGVSFARAIFLRTIDSNALRKRVLVLGAGKKAAAFLQLRRRSDQRGFHIVGFVHITGEANHVDPARIIHLDRPLPDKCRELEIDEIIVAVDDRRKNFPIEELLDCKLYGIDVLDALSFFERETGKIMLQLLSPSWLIFSEGFRKGTARAYAERVFDVSMSLALLAITWPLMLVTALAIAIESGWRAPILYRQVRVGANGRPFQLLKFRSMRPDAEQDGAKWAQKNDSRVTRVGAVIRKFRIDELPQLYNILRGDMSFVGPRPERPEFVRQLSECISYYDERHRVKPGLAGWAQLRYPYGSSVEDAAEKLQYDLYYVKNHSLLLDLLILIQTAEVVLFGKGAR